MVRGRPRRRLAAGIAVALAVVAAVAAASVAVLAGREGDEATPPPRAAAEPVPATAEDELARCASRSSADSARSCYEEVLAALVEEAEDPRQAVDLISQQAWADAGGFLLPNCHGLMHTVGREYAASHGVTLATLMDELPRSDDPGCSAGYAHGLVSGVAPGIDPRRPAEAAAICGEAATRVQRYSCTHGFGHAFMRMHGDELQPALAMCRDLGVDAAPDCAQGAYHDYWFAVIGFDDAPRPAELVTDPRELCSSQPREFVRPCWYRAFVDTRPPGFQTSSPAELDALCSGLVALQRHACMTAASVIGPAEPAEQLALCSGLAGPDAVACIRGTKVQNLLQAGFDSYVDLIRRCGAFPDETARACYRWLGKTLAVLTNGDFERRGCPQLAPASARRACVAGARTMEEALVTFS